MNNILKYKKIILFVFLIFIELISFLSFLNPSTSTAVFFVLSAAILLAGIYRLEYAVYILLAELIIGSKGYLFSLHIHNISISIRMAIWLIIMAVWFSRFLIDWSKNRSWPKLSIPNLKLFLILFAFIILGIANGLWRQNGYANIFFDFNGWLFFLLILPLTQIKIPNFFENTKNIFISSTLWLSIKTILLLYIFSHDFFILPVIYKWVRNTGVGEITLIQSGFYRIFIQSHIYIMIALITLWTMWILSIMRKKLNFREIISSALLSSVYLSAILISFSRSFWVGLVATIFIIYFFIIFYYKFSIKSVVIPLLVYLLTAITAVVIVTTIVRFPLPVTVGNFNTAGLLTDRANDLAGEAGVSSRWALLPVLVNKILKSPFIGFGYGATVTYHSSDPRVLSQNPNGLYTTYAFEWGWLDTWLKIGLFGIVSYLFIIFYFIFKIAGAIKKNEFVDKNYIVTGLLVSLAAIAILNNFSPYMNHPLGIFFVLILNKYLFSKQAKFSLL